MSKGPEETQRARNRLSYSRCTILETALLHTCNLFLCISLRWEVVHSQCSRLWLSSLTPMTAAVISQQLIWDLLILSAQEERAREGDTGLVCIRRSKEGKKDIGRNRSMRKIKKKKSIYGVLFVLSRSQDIILHNDASDTNSAFNYSAKPDYCFVFSSILSFS